MKRNWFALAAGVLMFATVASSLSSPWWKVQVGSGLLTVNIDPFFTNFNILGVSYVVPILFALNVGTAALFIAGGIALIVYTVKPVESYSKHLLSFGWKRPLYVTVGFIAILALFLHVAPIAVNAMAHSIIAPTPIVPLMGSSTIQLPSGISEVPAQVTITAAATFTYSFFLGVATAVLSVAARIHHRRNSGVNKATKA
jgi:hypothetical protein